MNVIEKTKKTPKKGTIRAVKATSTGKVAPMISFNGKRSLAQIQLETRFAKAVSTTAFKRFADHVRALKNAGKLVDCSI